MFAIKSSRPLRAYLGAYLGAFLGAFVWGCFATAETATAAAPAPQTVDSVAVEESADFVARDARVSFDKRSADFARLDLEELSPGDYGRSTAIVALGASGSVRGRSYLLDETALDHLSYERAAAAYALGELGERGLDGASMDRLIALADDPDPLVRTAALVGLVRTGSQAARQTVARIAGSADETAPEARQILAHHADPRGSEAPKSYRRLYELRWGAGRTYGVVDGKVWGATLMKELAQNKIFLEAVTLQLTRELDFPGAKDHMLEILLEGEGTPRIVESIQLMPLEVEMLIDSGVWVPQDLKEWRWVVVTVLNNELHSVFPRTLLKSMALENSPTRWIAAGLLYREDKQFKEILDEGFRHPDPNYRAYSLYAAAAVELEDYLERMKQMCDDPDPWVKASAIGALIRMGSQIGAEKAIDLLAIPYEDRPPQVASFLFEILERFAPDQNVMRFVETIAPNLDGADRAAADSLLLIHGALIGSDALRHELPLISPIMPEAHRGVRGLARISHGDDVKLLARMFPRESAYKMNAELAVALARAGHRAPEPLLQAAVWTLPLNQSVLAAGCVRATYGEATLLDWVTDPPPTATESDIMRLGYAIGEWGGLPAVQDLQRRLGTTSGAELPALRGAILGALGARTR
ncbi:HEAT repeat protein [Planctomycetes bacterium Poly30]|uniref:HEAT repeat protein n=2 Tax=Saltatorellus ferox TaxID=2528018 RepID=A0A518EU61_9BACT|nr:HEAT repeat protein [Planctomycetes bacterium Poly30]